MYLLILVCVDFTNFNSFNVLRVQRFEMRANVSLLDEWSKVVLQNAAANFIRVTKYLK